jgi:hypothetical protein
MYQLWPTFYNHYADPLGLLIQVLLGDLERAHHDEEERRAEGSLSAAEMLRLSIVDVADHIERGRLADLFLRPPDEPSRKLENSGPAPARAARPVGGS